MFHFSLSLPTPSSLVPIVCYYMGAGVYFCHWEDGVVYNLFSRLRVGFFFWSTVWLEVVYFSNDPLLSAHRLKQLLISEVFFLREGIGALPTGTNFFSTLWKEMGSHLFPKTCCLPHRHDSCLCLSLPPPLSCALSPIPEMGVCKLALSLAYFFLFSFPFFPSLSFVALCVSATRSR